MGSELVSKIPCSWQRLHPTIFVIFLEEEAYYPCMCYSEPLVDSHHCKADTRFPTECPEQQPCHIPASWDHPIFTRPSNQYVLEAVRPEDRPKGRPQGESIMWRRAERG